MKITTTKVVRAESGPYMIEQDQDGYVWIYEDHTSKTELTNNPDHLLALAACIRAVAGRMKSAEVDK
jgi:hypothetical protein